MNTKKLVAIWFECWRSGNFNDIPVTDDFSHTSPFGTFSGKRSYLETVQKNTDKFLGFEFDIIDAIYESEKACTRYTAIQNDFRLEVSEWYYFTDGLIGEIVSYYHIGEIQTDRVLSS